MKAELNEDESRIIVECSFTQKDQVLQLPGGKWDRTNHYCTLPKTWAAAKQLRGIFGETLEIGEGLYKWAVDELETRVKPSMELRQTMGLEEGHPVLETLKEYGYINGDNKLFSFQQSDVAFMLAAKNCLVGTPMGGGKSVVTVVAARLTGAKNILVTCPMSMRRTWKSEIEKWWPGIPVTIIEGSKKQRIKAFDRAKEIGGWIVIGWETLRLHTRLAPYGSTRMSNEERTPKELNNISFDIVIADEAHRLANVSKMTRSIWAVGHGPTVQYRWALTGTPVTNKPDTLYPLLHFLDPIEWPSKTSYIDRYCDSAPSHWGPGLDIFGLSEDTKEEFFEIFDPRFRRMPKEVILPNLPPIQRVRKYVTMGDAQHKAYEEMAEEMVTEDENGELIIAVNPVSKLTRLVQYASASIHKVEDRLRLTDPSCKLDQLMIDLPDYLEAEESVVIFAVSRQLIEMAEKRLEEKKIPYSVIKGNQSADFRQHQIDDFQEGKVPIILVVTAAGSSGITLTKARITIFLQRSYSHVDQSQCEGRTHRIGSERHKNVMYIDYITEGTVETRICDMLENKAAQLETIVRDREAVRRMLYGLSE